jgi:membrane protease YdiL (CAAX protease family)
VVKTRLPRQDPILRFGFRRPKTYATLSVLSLVPLFIAGSVLGSAVNSRANEHEELVFIQIFAVLVYLWMLRRDRDLDPTWKPRGWTNWPIICIPTVMIVVVMGYSLFSLDLQPLGWKILGNMMVGVTEEALLRGIVLVALLRSWGSTQTGTTRAVVVSSSLFGLLHLTNFRDGWVPTIFQVVFAAFVGICFSGVFLRTRALPALMVVHGLIDVASAFGTPNETLSLTVENVIFCFATAPFAYVGLRLIRGRTVADLDFLVTTNQIDRKKDRE